MIYYKDRETASLNKIEICFMLAMYVIATNNMCLVGHPAVHIKEDFGPV